MKTDALITELCNEIDQLKEELEAQKQRNKLWKKKYIKLYLTNFKTQPMVKDDLIDPEKVKKVMTEFYRKQYRGKYCE